MHNLELEKYMNELLSVQAFKDYCPNGLQVEGKDDVQRIMTGVTASQALIDAAVEQGVDALVVHHGFFWKGEPAPIRGIKYRRIKALMDHGINLYAYHLPLDAHTDLGNNALLGQKLGLKNIKTLEPSNPCSLVATGNFERPITGEALAELLSNRLDREPLRIEGLASGSLISNVGWCTGGGQDFIESAAEAGLDAFISGEISERTTHLARELGIDYFAAGHHATERYGVEALGEHLAIALNLNVEFVDISNPA